MKNDIYSDIGRRIKSKRLQAGLTQSSLCGDRITRNMLSRIETGDAHPSLDTLLYLAEKLKTPAAYFLCRDKSEESQYDKAVLCTDIRRLIGGGRYDRAAASIGDSNDDEVLFAKALSEGKCAVSELERFNFSASLKHVRSAASAAGGTVYLQDQLLAEIDLIKNLCTALKEGELPSAKLIAASSSVMIGSERHMFLLSLTIYNENGDMPKLAALLPENTHYRKYLETKRLVHDKQYNEALTELRYIISGNAGALVMIPAMKDAELCFYETEQYKEAYEISKRRETLLNKD